jgi:hypothetical protein
MWGDGEKQTSPPMCVSHLQSLSKHLIGMGCKWDQKDLFYERGVRGSRSGWGKREEEKREIHISRVSEHCLQSMKVITTKISKYQVPKIAKFCFPFIIILIPKEQYSQKHQSANTEGYSHDVGL